MRRQADEQDAIAFPWSRLLPGLIACAAVTVAGLAFLPPMTIPESVAATLRDPVFLQVAVWVPLACLGNWALVRGALRVAGYRR